MELGVAFVVVVVDVVVVVLTFEPHLNLVVLTSLSFVCSLFVLMLLASLVVDMLVAGGTVKPATAGHSPSPEAAASDSDTDSSVVGSRGPLDEFAGRLVRCRNVLKWLLS